LKLFYKEKISSISNKMKEQGFLGKKRFYKDFWDYFAVENNIKQSLRLASWGMGRKEGKWAG
jgi:hypothetical protein